MSKMIKTAYTEYECYVLPREKKLIYERLIDEGYSIDEIS